MSKRPQPSVANDLITVLAFLTTKGVIPASPSPVLLDHAKKIHRATFSLILWRFRLRGLPDRGKVFVEEIASDALQILPQCLMGYGKTTKLLTRGIIENVLRHLYFSDHPVEFERMNREQKWFITMTELLAYALAHPVFLKTEPRFDAINRISSLYSDLSAGIHGRRVHDLEMRTALRKITYDETAATKDVALIERCAEASNFVLAMYHQTKMRRFQLEDKRIILHTMAPRARQVWRDL